MDHSKELMEKGKNAASSDALLALAKENGWDMTREEAKSCLDQMKRHSALSDDELEGVTGGGRNGKPMILGCEDFLCKKDERHPVLVGHRRLCDTCRGMAMCSLCYYGAYDMGVWTCQRIVYMKHSKKW